MHHTGMLKSTVIYYFKLFIYAIASIYAWWVPSWWPSLHLWEDMMENLVMLNTMYDGAIQNKQSMNVDEMCID
jgi:hypothetical protein